MVEKSFLKVIVGFLLFALWTGQTCASDGQADLALVLAVDVSSSITFHEHQVQRQAYADAFRSPLVHQAIRKGALGRIMVAYVEWAEAKYQDVVLPWSILSGADDAIRFAEDLKTADTGYGGYTSISAAIEFSARLLAKTPLNPARRVIDISGDGRNNDGPSLTEARSRAVAEGSRSTVFRCSYQFRLVGHQRC
jgi:hypothetical protein